MSGAMRKMGVYLGLVEDDLDEETHPRAAGRSRSHDERAHRDDRYDYDDAEYDDVEVEEVEPEERAPRRPRLATIDREDDDAPRYAARESAPAPAPRAPHRITTLHPRTYNEARAIGEEFRDGNPVIMNLSEMDDADAKRLVDFAAGITFGLRGSIERVTAKVFLLSPQKVKVSAEEKARIADGRYPSES